MIFKILAENFKGFLEKPVFSRTYPVFNPYKTRIFLIFLKTPGFKNPYLTRTKPVINPYKPVKKIWVFWALGWRPTVADF